MGSAHPRGYYQSLANEAKESAEAASNLKRMGRRPSGPLHGNTDAFQLRYDITTYEVKVIKHLMPEHLTRCHSRELMHVRGAYLHQDLHLSERRNKNSRGMVWDQRGGCSTRGSFTTKRRHHRRQHPADMIGAYEDMNFTNRSPSYNRKNGRKDHLQVTDGLSRRGTTAAAQRGNTIQQHARARGGSAMVRRPPPSRDTATGSTRRADADRPSRSDPNRQANINDNRSGGTPRNNNPSTPKAPAARIAIRGARGQVTSARDSGMSSAGPSSTNTLDDVTLRNTKANTGRVRGGEGASSEARGG